jgi:GxxExxY protein
MIARTAVANTHIGGAWITYSRTRDTGIKSSNSVKIIGIAGGEFLPVPTLKGYTDSADLTGFAPVARKACEVPGSDFRGNYGTAHPSGMGKLIDEELTHCIIGAFFDVYNTLGFGFIEKIYVMALERELRARGHQVQREVSVTVMYKGEELSSQRLDMVVDGRIIIEIKSTLELQASARRQLYNYLKATNLDVGLLLHFGPTARFHREVRSSPKQRSAESGKSAESVSDPPT